MRFSCLSLALPLLCTAGPGLADTLVVVPGKNTGFLYTGAEQAGSKAATLSLFKQGGFTAYRIESEPPGMLCDENCGERMAKVKSGPLVLRIIGNKPTPGVTIPLKGIWSAPCANTSTPSSTCDLVASNAGMQITVDVDDKLEMGTEIPLPEGGSALYVQTSPSGHHVVTSAQVEQGGPYAWLHHTPSRISGLGIDNPSDGPGNTLELAAAGSPAASRCAAKQPAGAWYLPAQEELKVLTSAVQKKIAGFNEPWSSTEYGFSHSNKSSERSWRYDVYYARSSGGTTYGSAYEYKEKLDKKSTAWYESSNYTTTRAVLCFRRLRY
ncbi:hypothetical protein [Comamonas composti]|uniref:hypothetical protein n=1 Tax=Comamonas composti TaxID=408558 RepID=UPI000422923B|nr:hypothetical protein [Comamonas composti]